MKAGAMFKRKCYDSLKQWKHRSNGESALLLEGARRVGKTTLVKAFAENEYDAYIYIDFSKAEKRVLDIFREHRSDTDTFLRMLQLQFTKRLEPRKSVIIFDEVQRFPMAREYVKHLVADGRFDYIETGSLVSIKKNVSDIVIPSEEDRMSLYPLDFEEYLWATGKEILAEEIRASYDAQKALPDAIHAQCMRLFNEYMIVGGMPQAVEAFAEDADFTRCDQRKRRILNLYIEDIAKFGGTDARRAKAIFQSIPGQLSHNSKRFKFSRLGKSVRYGNSESAVLWLDDSHTVSVCKLCTDPNVGLLMNAEEGSLKCYMADTGLLASFTFSDGPESLAVYRDIQFGKVSVNKGMMVENVVAQQLRASGHSLFYYSWHEPGENGRKAPKNYEIDFLLVKPYENAAGKLRVCPVEVKSSKNYTTSSLAAFKDKFGKKVGTLIILHPKQLRIEGDVQYLPLYMSHCL